MESAYLGHHTTPLRLEQLATRTCSSLLSFSAIFSSIPFVFRRFLSSLIVCISLPLLCQCLTHLAENRFRLESGPSSAAVDGFGHAAAFPEQITELILFTWFRTAVLIAARAVLGLSRVTIVGVLSYIHCVSVPVNVGSVDGEWRTMAFSMPSLFNCPSEKLNIFCMFQETRLWIKKLKKTASLNVAAPGIDVQLGCEILQF